MTTTDESQVDLDVPSLAARRLRALCGDRVALPGEPAYHAARTAWNVAVSQLPAATAVPSSAAEVQATVRAAVASGLRVAPQGSGHGAQALAHERLDDVLLLRTTALTEISIDQVRRVARVGAGVLSEDLVVAAAEHGLAPDRKIHQRFLVSDDKITISISNRGMRLADKLAREAETEAHVQPTESPDTRRGWGLNLIRGLMDDVRVEPVDDGTRITMTKFLREDARV